MHKRVAIELDDFSTGPYEFTSPPGVGIVNQSEAKQGTMAGGWRLVNIISGDGENKRLQPIHVDISNKVKKSGVLTLTVGTTATVHMGLLYGAFSGSPAPPLHLDVSAFTRCVVKFDWLLQSTKVNVTMFSGDGKRTTVGADTKQFGTEQNPHEFAFDLTSIQPDHDQANRRDITRFGVTFDTITGFSIESIALS